MQVLLATLPPEYPNGTPARGRPIAVVSAANDRIRQVAASEGVVLVDLFQGLGGTSTPYLGSDGLHLTEAGYHRMAELFFDTIRSRFENAPLLQLFQLP